MIVTISCGVPFHFIPSGNNNGKRLDKYGRHSGKYSRNILYEFKATERAIQKIFNNDTSDILLHLAAVESSQKHLSAAIRQSQSSYIRNPLIKTRYFCKNLKFNQRII